MNNRILITGASSDIGLEYIRQYADKYSFIIAHYNHSHDRVMGLQSTTDTPIMPIQADLSDSESVSSMVKQLSEQCVYPDCILHIAAPKLKYEKFHKLDIQNFERMIDTTLLSFSFLVQWAIPTMLKNRHGRIACVLSSVTKNTPPKYMSAYVATKYALWGLVRSLAVDYADKGITVNAISPNMIETRFIEDLPHLIKDEAIKTSSSGKLLSVKDIIPTIRFLLSDEANMITGQNVGITR